MTGASGTPAARSPATRGTTPQEQKGGSNDHAALSAGKGARDQHIGSGRFGGGGEQHRSGEPRTDASQLNTGIEKRVPSLAAVVSGKREEQRHEGEHHAIYPAEHGGR